MKTTCNAFYAVFAIDSWHLANGIHCPNVHYSRIYPDIESVIEWLVPTLKAYRLRDSKGNIIDNSYLNTEIEKAINKEAEYIFKRINKKDPNKSDIIVDNYIVSILFEEPREGYLIIVGDRV